MALNFEAAQFVVGAAVLDRRLAHMLLHDRVRALREIEALPIAPSSVRFSEEDRLLLGAVRANNVQEFARGVERMCGGIRPVCAPAAVPAADQDVAAAFAMAGAG
jgi:hypothetical protein